MKMTFADYLRDFFSKEEDKVIKITNSGRAYIEDNDFFKQEEIIDTIIKLSESDLVTQINKKKKLDTIAK